MSSKVRVACRRCRIKRIKCDGSIPACSNCQKAHELCMDVDGRNKSISIPRNFAANAKARIRWLEDHLKQCKPDLDLRDGPRVDFAFLDPVETPMPPAVYDCTQSTDINNPERASTVGKRPSSLISDQPPSDAFTYEARFAALDLGLLTLNSDSRQMHYLGTSSGRLFTSLIGAPSSERVTFARGTKSPRPPAFSNPRAPDTSAHARCSKESLQSLYKTLRKTMPSRKETDLLLETYFREIHSDYPFLHPSSLASAVEALHCCVDADETTEIGHNGWLCTVEAFAYNGEADHTKHTPISVFTATFHAYMVFTLAAVIRTRRRLFDFAPDQFYRVALSVGHHCFSSTSLASIQAILLMAVHTLVGPAEVNIWTLTYLAMAHCIDLGLHRSPSPSDGVSKSTVLIRKMIFFSVYHLDRSVAVIQGRPLGIRDETFDLELPNLDEIIDAATSIPQSPTISELPLAGDLVYTMHRFKLDPIFSETKLLFYHLPSQISVYAWPADHESSQHKIQHKLDTWRHELLSIGKVDAACKETRQVCQMYELKLMSQYFAAMILLHQPSQAIPQPSERSLLLCYQCAANRLTSYNDLYYMESFCPTWRDIQGVFSSGATMIYCLWTSALVRESSTTAEVTRDLRICTNLLSIGGESWPSVKKGAKSFTRAMDALLRELDPAAENRREAATEEGYRATQRRRLRNDHSPTIRRDLAEHAGFISQYTDPIFPAQPDDETPNTWMLPNEVTWHHDASAFHETIPSSNQDTAYSGVVEDFISEFLRDDAAWNPF